MNGSKSTVFNVVFILLLYWLVFHESEVKHQPGVLVPDEPEQSPASALEHFSVDHFEYKVLADYKIDAKVLGVEKYRFDDFAKLSPVDFALGWKRLSDQAVIDGMDISQSNRWYRWSKERNDDISINEVSQSSANVHMIPANKAIGRKLNKVRLGEVVSMSGHLVEITDTETGSKYTSSLTRNDTGGGACEVFWVTGIEIKSLPTEL